MAYRSILHTTSGVQVVLFRPRTASGQAAMLLGRTPNNWFGTDPSAQARKLVDEGYWVVAVDTPNWGNQTDMDSIDEALDWLSTTWSIDTDRVLVVAHNTGAVAALNWGLRHHERVASLSLQAPVIDLSERYLRLGTAASAPMALNLPGTNGSYAYTNDHTSLDIIGDIDIRAEVAATDWTPSATRSIVSKFWTGGSQRSYRLRITTAGRLEFIWSTNGSSQTTALSTVSPTVSDGATLAVRATLDVDNNASGKTVTFYTASTIAGPWTQLGSAVTTAGTTSIFPGTAPMEVGSAINGTEVFQGNIFKVEVRDGIDGTLVANPIFSKPAHANFTDTSGREWLFHGSAYMILLASGGAETDAMEDAYGGTSATFAAAMPTWNPNFLHRRYMAADYLGDRLKMWWSGSDTNTPPAVTAEIATRARADTGTLTNTDPTLVDPAPVVSDMVAADEAWDQAPAHTRMAEWYRWIETSPNSQGYKGGDTSASVRLPPGTVLTDFPGGTEPLTLWFFSDNIIGSVNADGTYNGGLPLRNAIIIEDGNGTIIGQKWGPGNSAPLIPNQTSFPAHWYWPSYAVIENGQIVVTTWLVSPGGGFGLLTDTHIIRLDLSTLAINDITPLGSAVGGGADFWPITMVETVPYTYIYAQEWIPSQSTWIPELPGNSTVMRVARVTTGQLTNVAAWEYWDGAGWSASKAAAAPLVDTNSDPIFDDACVAVVPGGYLLAAKRVLEPFLRLYQSSQPQGPWTAAGTTPDIGEGGTERYSGTVFLYHPKFHPEITLSGSLMLTYHAGDWENTVDLSHQDFSLYHPRFVVVPLP